MHPDREIEVLPYQQLGGIAAYSSGHGIFVDCGRHRMNVGAILPVDEGKFLVTVQIMDEMEVPDFELCEMWKLFDNFEDARKAALDFLESKRRL